MATLTWIPCKEQPIIPWSDPRPLHLLGELLPFFRISGLIPVLASNSSSTRMHTSLSMVRRLSSIVTHSLPTHYRQGSPCSKRDDRCIMASATNIFRTSASSSFIPASAAGCLVLIAAGKRFHACLRAMHVDTLTPRATAASLRNAEPNTSSSSTMFAVSNSPLFSPNADDDENTVKLSNPALIPLPI